MVLKPWLGMSSATISVGWVDAIAPMPKDISEKGEKKNHFWKCGRNRDGLAD